MPLHAFPHSERFVSAGEIQLRTESFGEPNYPAVLLVMGAWNQGIMWPDEFCVEIAEHGYYVVRYDHRDTGQSSAVDFKAKPYDLDALARDAVSVLDGHNIGKAHVVGMSMGGFIAQLLVLDHPDRILTLTPIMSSPDQRGTIAALLGQPTSGYELSPPSPEVQAHFARMRQSPPNSLEEAVENTVESWRIVNGSGMDFDEAWTRRLVERSWARVKNPVSASNHSLAMAASPSRADRLHGIKAPTLVIHGQHDPLLPLDHGVALAERIPHAKLAVIPDMGHMLRLALCGRIAKAVLELIGQGLNS
jgi:pimeloyl-ACP methyl ester carboxylesterase